MATSVLFALIHVPIYGWHVVPLDVGVGLWFGGLRLWFRRPGCARRGSRPGGPRDLVAVMGRRRLALAALAAGLGLVVAAQRLAPISGPPLYDGVVVEDEYKWLSPPAGYQGGAPSAAATVPVQGGQSPNVAVATSEQPPQAQVFAGAGYLDMHL